MSGTGPGLRYLWLLVLGLLPLSIHASHFRGGIIMVRPLPDGGENEMEITFHVSWRRSSSAGGSCSATTIANGNLIGEGQLDCQYGCPSTVSISSMFYRCTDFSEAEDWSYGERRLAYTFSGTAPITIGFSGCCWIRPFSSSWNLPTTFSMVRRNDTGRINSTPRAATAPVIYVQEGCNNTISIAVNDPDDDIVRCRWAQGVECGGICNQLPGAELNPESCRIKYQANRGTGFRAAALMIEDFIFNSTSPLSSVALQFLVLVVRSNEPCSSKPEFIPPTISQGACIAIPPSTTFNTALVATSGGSELSIREIQTVSPVGLEKGELHHIEKSSSFDDTEELYSYFDVGESGYESGYESSLYYVNITWTPTASQQNQTHSFCYTALNSAGVSSEQTCIEFFPGEFPPTPLQATATPNGQLVHPSNTTWHIQFDTEIQRPTVVAFITFHERDTNREVYKIDTSSSSEVTFIQPNRISITPRYFFAEEVNFYINFERGVVRGIPGCKPGNEPLTEKNFWIFETRDVTPPVLWFIARPSLSNANVTFLWASNEVVTWACMLIEGATVLEVNCSEAYWRGYGLTEGTYTLRIEATDEGGNMAHLSQIFEVDLTPPTTSILYKPASVSNQERAFFRFRCNEFCSLECQFVAGGVPGRDLDYFPCNSGRFTTFTLQHDSNYTFSVSGTDRVGNKGEAVMYMWETDFEKPSLFGVRNLSIPCTNNTSPDHTGQAQATDNREEAPSVMYRDLYTNCFVKRTWSATDIAGNTASLVQYITLDFSPSISLLPVFSFQCDSTSANPIQVPTDTASSPNPCRRQLHITYEDSIENYMCPGIFNRTWTVVDTCNQKNTSSSQTISLYDVCPPYACGRNETSKPEFIPPTISQGACIAIPPSTTFNTALVATSGGSELSIREIQTVSPVGLEKGELHHIEKSSSFDDTEELYSYFDVGEPGYESGYESSLYYVNITWTPTASQQNQTHSFCYTALNSAGVSSEQTCIEFFPGEFPPTPLQATATPNGQLVHPSNTTWHIQFDTEIQRPTVVAFITFHERDTNREVYKIDTSSSSEVTFIRPNRISITPRYFFAEEVNFYINFERGVVRGIPGCKPGNEPLTEKNFWIFETRDVTPPVLWFIARPSLSNANVTFLWASNEVVTWACMLIEGATVLEVNCSEAYWRGYGLTEGTYTLRIEATDEGGNMARLSQIFEVDLTPPTTSILYKPASVSNQKHAFFRFRCNEFCSLECQFVAGGVPGRDLDYFPCNSGRFTTFTLQHDSNYTFSVRGTDRVGNKGEAVMYMWETDFEKPSLFGVRNLSIPCTNNTSPDHTGQAQATDNREEAPSVMYRDLYTNCFVKRTWSATDVAGNTASLVQYITLDFSPSISLLPVFSFQCDSTSVNSIQVPTNTASSPNPCRRPLQITYKNSIDNYMCPGIFNRTWTVVDICNQKNTSSSQTISLYDVCPPYACGRNETTPHGVCIFGTCQCNSPWFGEDCNALIYEPQIEPVNDVVLQEAEDYTENVVLIQGTPPLSWSLLLGPDRLTIDQLSGQITWRRAQAGNYTVSVQADNRAGRATVTWSLCVKAGYNATLDIVSPNTYPGAQPIQLTGHVQYKAGNVIKNVLASVVPVSIDITSEQTTRLLKTFTNRDGNFSTIFYPARTEFGMYTARARHPSTVFQSTAQTQWQFLGMKATPRLIQLNGETIGTYVNTFHNATMVINDGPAALSNLRAVPVLGNIVGLRVQVQLNGARSVSILQPGDSVLMNINIETTGAFDAVFPIRLETTEGTTLYLSVNLRITQILPSFVVSPPSVNSRIIRGSSNIFQFNVTNVGRIEATSVRVLLPTTDFISFISFGTIQQAEGVLTIGSRESAILSILVQTPSNQQLGDISGNLIISSTETSKRVPFTFAVSSNVQMNFTVRVEDEYTYFAEGEPLVSNAIIRLVNRQRNIRITKSTEADNGTATFINIPEDRYELHVEAPNHLSINQIILTSIDTPVLTVFIQRQAVTYTWSVSPTTFEDTYTITLEADFETHVPQPVVTVTPTEIELEELELGLVDTLQFNITNHGLIRAENVEFELPDDHPFLKFTTNANNLGSVEPLSSIIVPVQVSRKTREKRAIIQVIYVINIVYRYVCREQQVRRIPVIMKKQEYRPDIVTVLTQITWPQCNECGGGGGGVPGFKFNGLSANTPAFCNKCLQSMLDCAPTPNFPGADCILELASGSIDVTNPWDWLNCGLKLPWPVGPRKTPSQGKRRRKSGKLDKFKGWLNCFDNLYTNCLESESSGSRRRRTVTSMVNDLTEAMYPIHLSIALGIEVLGDELWITTEDPKWLSNILRPTVDDESDGGVLISRTELSAILSAPLPNGTTIEAVTRMVKRLNNTLFGWNNGQLEPQNTSSNMASYSTVQELTQDINTYQQKAQGKGFSSYLEAYNFAANELSKLDSWEDEAGVCAVVRIRVEQELAVTREAFLAKLEIENNEESSLEEVRVEIVITDTTTAEEATGRFSIGNSTLSGSLNSDLSLPSGMSGSAEWLIVPYSEAAPTSNRIYDVGGVLSYTLNGEEIVIPLLPTKITVIPDPSLLVHYFWEKYVIGDDPFTEEREPSVPFTLGVVVKNSGYGTAYNLHITSAQPEIIENEKGLLVTFRIIGANVGKESISPSLTVNFDDITPNTTKVARWYMVSSLQGEFKNYSATFENVNPLGDPKLSILDELKIHELIRNVHIYIGEENDEILDFLVNDRNDLGAYPDALYSSKTLQQCNVTTGEILSVQSVDSGSMSLEVQASSNGSGWTYFRYEDTQSLFTSTALAINFTKNEDSRSVPLPPENCWITRDRQRTRNNVENKQPFYLHILDYIHDSESVVYTLNLCTFDCRTDERPYEPVITVTAPTVTATSALDITTTRSFPIPTLDITTTLTFTTPSPDVTTIAPTPVTMVMTPTPVTATPLPTVLELHCEREVIGDRLVVSGCTTNRPAVILCSFEQQPQTECVFPVDIDLSRQLPGVYSLEINATDIFNLRNTSVISYTKPSLQVTFINSSPRVSGKTMIADFTINRPTVSVDCRLSSQPSKECSSGSVRYDSLSSGTYILRIVARAANGEKDIERRKIHIGSSCSVHLINEGVVVNGHDVTVQFLGGSSVQSYLCKLSDSNYHSCRSPVTYNLAAGNYHFQVVPQGCGRERRKLSVKFDIEE